jgi:CrcB protein
VTWLLVGAGGALGAMARHGLNGMVHRFSLDSVFPHGIFLVNLLGSVAIGLVAGMMAGGRVQIAPDVRTFLVVGILGGFTTFSSFGLDTFTLLRTGHVGLGLWNAFGQVSLGLIGVALGYRVGMSV